MKKILALALLACMMPTIASAKTATYLDDSASFTIAKSVKLGLGEDEMRSAPATGGQRKVEADKHAVTKCAKDEDCASDQYCTMGMCKDLCARNTTKKKVKCSGETPVCTATTMIRIARATTNRAVRRCRARKSAAVIRANRAERAKSAAVRTARCRTARANA